jgi:ubiquinone/menaquinone biosynthesis C-methylase UbiE
MRDLISFIFSCVIEGEDNEKLKMVPLEMSEPQGHIKSHYARNHIFETIVQALEQTGMATSEVTPAAIAAVDEFHVRGREASMELALQAGLQPGMQVLDIGCGLGGAARLLAGEFGCQVTGIDITPEYIRTAQELSQLTHMQQLTHFEVASALALPFDNSQFDIVWTQHVQMNIADKSRLYAEVARVLQPNGRFVYYDVLSKDHAPVRYPVPWAADASMSYLVTPDELRNLLLHAHLTPVQITDQTGKGIQFFDAFIEGLTAHGFPAIGTHLLMGDNAREKLQNLYTNLTEGAIILESGIYQPLTNK